MKKMENFVVIEVKAKDGGKKEGQLCLEEDSLWPDGYDC